MKNQFDSWDTRTLPVGQRVEAWQVALSASLIHFDVDVPDPAVFQAVVCRRRLGDLSLIDCATTPSAGRRGRRGRRELSMDPGLAGVLVVSSGREYVSQGGHEVIVGPGDALVWDGDRPAEFQVLEPLRKRSLLLPRSQVIGLGGSVPVHVPAGSPHGRLLVGYLDMLSRELTQLDEHACASAGNAALELLRAVVAPATADLRTTVLPQVRAFVDAGCTTPTSPRQTSRRRMRSPSAHCTLCSPPRARRSAATSVGGDWKAHERN